MNNELAKDILQMIEHAKLTHDEKKQVVHQWIKLIDDIKYMCIGAKPSKPIYIYREDRELYEIP